MPRGRTATLMWSTFRGATAALSMSGMRTLTTQFGLVRQTPPEVVVHSNVPGLLAQVPEERRGAVVELVHCGYGAMGGALYACLPESVRRPTWAGPLYGTMLWLGFEALINPFLGVRDTPERNWPGKVAVAADHVLYGVILAEPRKAPRASPRPTNVARIVVRFRRTLSVGLCPPGSERLAPGRLAEHVASGG